MQQLALGVAFAVLPVIKPAAAIPSPGVASKDGNTFTIGQLADLHYGEGENVWWGPVQDANSTRVIKNVLSSEPALDFLVFSGDQITGNNIVDNASAYLKVILDTPAAAGIPWASALGNHDDAPFEGGPRSGSVTTRAELVRFEQTTYPGLSHTQLGPPDLAGVTNYFIPVYADAVTESPSLLLYVVDSGGGSYAEEVFPNQISWLNATLYENALRYGTLPSLTFVHIPTAEFVTAYSPDNCFGILADDGVTPTVNDTGLFSLLAGETGAPVQNVAVLVGHDHGNAWCCSVRGMWACFGRHSGYGGYGSWDRGSRIIQATFGTSRTSTRARPVISIETWVRMEDGTNNSQGCLFPPLGAPGCP